MDEDKYARKQARWEEKIADRMDRAQQRMDRMGEKMNFGPDVPRAGRRSDGGNGLVVGAIIVVVGLVLLLDNLGLVQSGDLFSYWPLALVAMGVARILKCRRPASLLWGGLLAAAGTLLFLDNIGIVTIRFSMLWPLVLVGFGASMLFRSVERSTVAGGGGADGAPNFSLFAMFGGSKRRFTSPDFHGGEAFAFCGGFHIDLRAAQMPSARAVIDVNTIFGGCEILVPDSWTVNAQAAGIFGGVEDKTVHPRPMEGVPAPELVVTGTALFGGITIRN
jgi:predicted membrane protein